MFLFSECEYCSKADVCAVEWYQEYPEYLVDRYVE